MSVSILSNIIKQTSFHHHYYKCYNYFISFRPGNFSTHARLCLELLLDILTALSDLTSLIFIAQQLKTKVDPSK